MFANSRENSLKNMIHPSETSISKIIVKPKSPTSDHEYEDRFTASEKSLIYLSYFIFIITFPLAICFSVKIVQEYERAIVFRLGRLLSGKARGPGMILILPCIDTVVIADLRTQTFNVPPQEVLTKDSVTVTVDAVVYIKVFDPTSSVIQVENAQFSTRTLASTTIRNVFGTKTLQEILGEREVVAQLMQEILDATTHKWGVAVERVEVKDVSLPVQMQRVMATEAESTREAKAKLIAAEGEEKASKHLRDAAKILMEAPAALQLRYFQTLTDISTENSSTIIFPVPIEMAYGLTKRDKTVKTEVTKMETQDPEISKVINEIENDLKYDQRMKSLGSIYKTNLTRKDTKPKNN